MTTMNNEDPADPNVHEPLYTADQMREAIAAERERSHELLQAADHIRAELEAKLAALSASAASVQADQRAEIDAANAELALRRKSGSASERLHNICEGISKDADGSEWSREEWEKLDADMLALRKERDAANAVLDELIACKDLKDDIDKMPSCKARWLKEEEYDLRDPLAWEAARTLRKGTT